MTRATYKDNISNINDNAVNKGGTSMRTRTEQTGNRDKKGPSNSSYKGSSSSEHKKCYVQHQRQRGLERTPVHCGCSWSLGARAVKLFARARDARYALCWSSTCFTLLQRRWFCCYIWFVFRLLTQVAVKEVEHPRDVDMWSLRSELRWVLRSAAGKRLHSPPRTRH